MILLRTGRIDAIVPIALKNSNQTKISCVTTVQRSYLDQQCNRFVDEDCRDKKLKDVLCEACKVFDQEATFQSNHTKQNDHDPKTNPTTPCEELYIIRLTKLKKKSYNIRSQVTEKAQ